jgi:hypothetical protein
MAKLSAHGSELARLIRTLTYSDGEIAWERVELSFRTDGHILKKRVLHWRTGVLAGESHDYGWKLHKRTRDRKPSADAVLRIAERKRDVLTERDWEYPDTTLTVEYSAIREAVSE